MKRRNLVAGFGVLALAFGGLAFPPAGDTDLKPCPDGRPAPVGLHRSSSADETTLAMEWHRGRPYLARLDTRTLQSHDDPKIRVNTVATVSPDETRFVTPLGDDHVPDGGGMRLKFVDLASMRVNAEVPLGAGGGVHSLNWFENNRLLVVAAQPARVFIVDAATHEVLKTIPLSVDQVFEVRRADESVAVLTSAEPGSSHPSESSISPTRLHVVTTAGELRSTDPLDVNAGYEFDRQRGGRHRYPGLAVDERGSRAFIVDGPQRVAEIDLYSMEVAYRAVGEPAFLWARLASFFASVAQAKLSTGPFLHVHDLPNGSLLVTGVNEGVRRSPVHMTLIDTKTWKACRLNTDMSDAAVDDDAIVTWDSIVRLGQGRAAREQSSTGVAVYDLEGHTRVETLQQTPICWLDLAEGTAYAYKCGGGVAAIDITTGDVRHLRPGHPIQLVTRQVAF